MLDTGDVWGKDTEYVRDSHLNQNPRTGEVLGRNEENMNYFLLY